MRSRASANLLTPPYAAVAARASSPAGATVPLPGGLTLTAEQRAATSLAVVIGDAPLRESCVAGLRDDGFAVVACGRGDEALDLFTRRAFDVSIVDLTLSRGDGYALLRTALTRHAGAIVIAVTDVARLEASAEAVRDFAWAALTMPVSVLQLRMLAMRAAHTAMVTRETRDLATRPPSGDVDQVLVGESAPFVEMRREAQRIAQRDTPVLLTGERGTGKTLLARGIHAQSRRASRPFTVVNCAALPETLLEAELFGSKRGAFPGASRDRAGAFETTAGGTLYLDAITDCSLSTQAKLAHVLHEGVVHPIGGESETTLVNVRVIGATSRDTTQSVRAGTLRPDLLERLTPNHLHVPALHKRGDDVALLARHFLSACFRQRHPAPLPLPTLGVDALAALATHRWRGNIRELRQVMDVAAAHCSAGVEITIGDLTLHAVEPELDDSGVSLLLESVLDQAYHPARERVIACFERAYLEALVRRAGGNMSEAARIAGVDRTTLYRLMDRHGIHRSAESARVVGRVPRMTPVEGPPRRSRS